MTTRRSGLTLVLLGLAGVGFFWLTDPRFGYFDLWGRDDNIVDRVNNAFVPTIVGLVGSMIVLLIGLWLAQRRPA